MKKTLLQIAIITLGMLLLLITIYAYATFDGFRDYKTFCSKYIPKLEQYKQKSGYYPKSLKQIEVSIYDFRYNYKECGYKADKNYFSFYFSDGFIGVYGYNSTTKKWWHD